MTLDDIDISGVDPEDVARVLAALLAKKKSAGAPGLTIAGVFSRYRPWAMARLRASTWNAVLEPQFRLHLLPFFGELTWQEATHAKIDEYVERRQGQRTLQGDRPVAARTINHEVGAIRSMLNWARRQRIIAHNPMEGWVDLPEPDNEAPSITRDELAQLLRHARPMLRLMMVFAYETGMRRDEWRLLKWGEVDSRQKVVNLPGSRTKSGKSRVVPLSDTALQVLDSVPRYPGGVYVFPNPNSREDEAVPKTTLYTWFYEARDGSGLKVRIHSLRHGFSREQALDRGMPIYMLMDILGHSSKEVHDRYTKMTAAHAEAARAYLNDRRGPKPANTDNVDTPTTAQPRKRSGDM